MGISCELIVYRQPGAVFKVGKPVRGVLKYAVNEPIKLKNIIISLIGEGKYEYSVTDQHNDSHNKSHHDSGETYINKHIYVLSAGETTVPTGSYEYNFEFKLPKNIPSSYKQRSRRRDFNCDISYYVKVTIKKASLFSSKRIIKKDIIVYGNVNPITPEGPAIYNLQKSLFQPFFNKNKMITLKAELVKSLIKPRESAEIKFSVTNDSERTIRCIRVDLIRRVEIKTKRKRKNIITEDKAIDKCTAESKQIAEHTTVKMTSIVPTTWDLYSIHNSNIITVNYFLKVTLVLPIPHLNSVMEIPIAIGENN